MGRATSPSSAPAQPSKPKKAKATDRRPLSQVARHVIVPAGIVASEWPAVRETCRRLGWGFDGWQDGAGMLALALRADGEYAADTTVFSIPRQVGKTYLIGCIIFALCLMKPGLTVIWTAQIKDTALETFDKFVELIENSPRLKRHIRATPHGKGDEAIYFHNGSSIEFGARESGFGRGRTDVDVIVFDEGQHLSNDALENMGAAQNVAVNPLCFVIGTPPRPKDKGEWFTLLRQEALDGESDGTLYIEFSADRGSDPMDRDQWRKANPSFPTRTSERAMLRLRKKLKNEDSWRREALGIWDEITKQFSPINGALWADAVDIGPVNSARPDALGVDMSHGREISVGAAWRVDDAAHLEEVWAGVDEAVAVEWVVKAAGRRTPVVIDSASPANSMIPTLRARGCKIIAGTAGTMSQSCGLVVSHLEGGRLSHGDQESVNDARAGARKRAIGTAGGWGYDRKDPSTKIHPLVAITLALGGAMTTKKTSGDGRRSTGRRRATVS
jgi:phage terminase large subunit-like protein